MRIGDLPPWEMTSRFQRVRPLKGEVPPPPPPSTPPSTRQERSDEYDQRTGEGG